MLKNTPPVSIGFVNCNRLHYLRASIESAIQCTSEYENKEIIVVDNASVEVGTKEYLEHLESRGIAVVRQTERDPSNEFAKGLNKIISTSSGKYIMLLQADMQFVLGPGWLTEYVNLCEKDASVGCITLDAQRNITNKSHKYGKLLGAGEYKFLYDYDRPPIVGAGDVFYPREVLEYVGPWRESNKNHEGGEDSETEMLNRVRKMLGHGASPAYDCVVPIIPPAIAIYTDPRGTNARVRDNRRYGRYVPPVSSHKYYHNIDYSWAIKEFANNTSPIGIEDYAIPNGWDKMLDPSGDWLKNPIRPETAAATDWEELVSCTSEPEPMQNQEAYIDEWLGD